MARALWFELPETYRLLTASQISEHVASLVMTETRHLDASIRRDVDTKITAAGIARMGPGAPRHARARMPTRPSLRATCSGPHRTEEPPVGLRPAPDTMSLPTGYRPAEQGVACLKALRVDHIQRHTDGGLTIHPTGRGSCERGNHAREMPGWNVETMTSGLDGAHHTIKITSPTGHTYLSRVP
jgi:hypothetical protein